MRDTQLPSGFCGNAVSTARFWLGKARKDRNRVALLRKIAADAWQNRGQCPAPNSPMPNSPIAPQEGLFQGRDAPRPLQVRGGGGERCGELAARIFGNDVLGNFAVTVPMTYVSRHILAKLTFCDAGSSMHSPSASLVEPVIDQTLRLRERIASGQTNDLLAIRSELRELLYRVQSGEDRLGRSRNTDYLGLSYPLACWIDEVMTSDTTVGTIWNESKLEGSLFGTNDRAWMFWRQADLAETMGYQDDVTVFYLCVSLGFTGQFSSEPEKIAAWNHRMRASLGMVPELTLPFATDLAPMTDVPPLMGTRRMRQASHVAWASAVVLLPTMSYLLVTSWTR